MKGDFSRIRFNPAKLYTAVLKQQGRVDLDSDANEQCAIDVTLRDTTNADIIGQYGGPADHAGFEISIDGGDIWISAGRYYVAGILVEIADRVHYDQQPYLLNPTNTAQQLLDSLRQAADSGGCLEFKLEVWQRMATALDDPCLLEPALNQADTTTRLQTIWRVVGTLKQPSTTTTQQSTGVATQQDQGNLQLLGDSTPQQGTPRLLKESGGTPGQSNTGTLQLNVGTPQQSNTDGPFTVNTGTFGVLQGMMGASASGEGSGCGCQPIPAAGYQGMENQLYRVEIHTPGDLTSATFKWSRENGSVVTNVVDVNGKTVTVASLGPDANLGFQVGQWVELSDDIDQFGPVPNQPGTLYQIHSINHAALQVTMTDSITGLHKFKNARMRRWDQSGSSATSSGIPVSSTPIPLENGIVVDFSRGQFRAGDYWTIPARTASGTIDWPPCGGDGKHFQLPKFIKIDRAPLASVSWMPVTSQNPGPGLINYLLKVAFVVTDRRSFFPSLATNAMHVDWISWDNADLMTLDQFLYQGLYVALDEAPTSPLDAAVFRVSLEINGFSYFRQGNYTAYADRMAVNQNVPRVNPNTIDTGVSINTGVSVDTGLSINPNSSGNTTTNTGVSTRGNSGANASASPQMFIGPALRQEYVLDGLVTKLDRRYGVGWVVNWNLPVNADRGSLAYALNSLLVNAYQSTFNANINPTEGNNNFRFKAVPAARVRVRLFGHMIYAERSNACGPAKTMYLDGQCFGKTKKLSDGSTGIALDEPSGYGAVASDFESWFYLSPAPQVNYVAFDPSSLNLTVNAAGGGSGSAPSVGTVTLSAPASSDLTINLSADAQSGVTLTFASPSITIPAGQTSGTFNVTVQAAANAGSEQVTFTVTATPQLETADISKIFSAQGSLYVTVNNKVSISTTSLPSTTAGRTYSTNLAATGGVTPYVWKIISGSLPSGMQLSTTGVISGTIPATIGSGNAVFTVQVTDSSSTPSTDTRQFTLVVYSPIEITTSALNAGSTGATYSQQLTATGGNGSYSWKLTSGLLPTGMTLSTSGLLSGTPTTATINPQTGGNGVTLNIEVTDTASPANTTSRTFTLAITQTFK